MAVDEGIKSELQKEGVYRTARILTNEHNRRRKLPELRLRNSGLTQVSVSEGRVSSKNRLMTGARIEARKIEFNPAAATPRRL